MPKNKVKEVRFTVFDDGSSETYIDPTVNIAELGAFVVILGHMANQRLDEQAARMRPISIVDEPTSRIAREILAGRNGS